MLPKQRRGTPLLALAPLVLAASLASVADGSLGARASIAGSPPIESVSLFFTGSEKSMCMPTYGLQGLYWRIDANVRLTENVQVFAAPSGVFAGEIFTFSASAVRAFGTQQKSV